MRARDHLPFYSVSIAALLALATPALAAEPVPGGACTTANYIIETGGPETSGIRNILRCNGSTWQQEMTIDVAGNVGVATAVPRSKLHVAADGSSANSGTLSIGAGAFDGTSAGHFGSSSSSNTNGTELAVNAASGYLGDLANFQVGGVTKFAIDATGNVGGANYIQAMGFTANQTYYQGFWDTTAYTSTSASVASPADTASYFANNANGDGSYVTMNLFATNTANHAQNAFIGAVSTANATAAYSPSIVFGQQTGATAYAERMRISYNGNVGIGTTNPLAPLSVSNGGNAGFEFYETYPGGGTGTYIQSFNRASSAMVPTAYFAASHSFHTNAGDDSMVISTAGKVGIGTTGPAYALDVRSGQVAGAGAFVNTSDMRLKKDVQPIAYGLDAVMALRPVSFNWKDQKQEWQKQHQLGLIAQQVETVVPEVVSTANDAPRTKSIAYGEIVPILIQAVQELAHRQDNEIEDLRRENADLRAAVCGIDASADFCHRHASPLTHASPPTNTFPRTTAAP